MKLGPHELGSPLWQKLETHYRTKLATYRAEIENPRIKPERHIELAWKIATIKGFLALAEPGQEQETDAG